MKRFPLIIAIASGIAACAQPATTAAPAPAPVTAAGDTSTTGKTGRIPAAEIPRPNPPLVLPPFQADTGGEQIPPFRTGPLITWGPPPVGAVHPERIRTYDLQHQSVTVRFDWTREAVVGSTTLRIAGLAGAEPLSDIAIDAADMTFRRVIGPTGRPLKHDYDGRVLTVHLASPLRAGARTSITIDYDGAKRKNGAYFRPARHIVWTQGEPEDTRYWVPTYDFPNDKTTWEFFIWTAKGERALSNGRLAGSRTVRDSIEWHWKQEKPASTYLMTTVVGNYRVIQDTPWKNVPIGYWTYPDSVAAARRGFARTPDAVAVFSRKTGVPYPWAKYDQIVIPQFQYGGMENVSATSQNDEAILHPASAEPQASSLALMAHELGHQWYGNLLTTRRWSDSWLNEGFATFMEQVYREESSGKDEDAVNRLRAIERSIAADRAARRPLVYHRWASHPFELFFTGHIYQKGAAVLQMIRHQLGDDRFWKAMNHYTTKHAYGNVVTEDFQRALEESTGREYDAFFHQWVYGAGLPAFQVSHLYDRAAGRLVITARQVHPRDSLTGYFDVDVDVEALTDSGAVRLVVPVRNGMGEAGVNLSAPPRSIRWDKGNWLLDLADFPRSTAMLEYQLRHDDDVTGRIEAVDLLAQRPDERAAVLALATAIRRDPFYAVRVRATDSLGAWAAEPTRFATAIGMDVVSAILHASRDADPRVRESAAIALGRVATGGRSVTPISQRVRELAVGDSSLYVRAAALASYIRLERDAALPLARELMAGVEWRNVIRTQALAALKALDTPDARLVIRTYEPAPPE